jgi:hypothetical protein
VASVLPVKIWPSGCRALTDVNRGEFLTSPWIAVEIDTVLLLLKRQRARIYCHLALILRTRAAHFKGLSACGVYNLINRQHLEPRRAEYRPNLVERHHRGREAVEDENPPLAVAVTICTRWKCYRFW